METKNLKIKNVKELKLLATKCEMDEKVNDVATGRKIEFVKYTLVLDGTKIGIGANDKFKELLKYLVGADDLEINQTVSVEIK